MGNPDPPEPRRPNKTSDVGLKMRGVGGDTARINHLLEAGAPLPLSPGRRAVMDRLPRPLSCACQGPRGTTPSLRGLRPRPSCRGDRGDGAGAAGLCWGPEGLEPGCGWPSASRTAEVDLEESAPGSGQSLVVRPGHPQAGRCLGSPSEVRPTASQMADSAQDTRATAWGRHHQSSPHAEPASGLLQHICPGGPRARGCCGLSCCPPACAGPQKPRSDPVSTSGPAALPAPRSPPARGMSEGDQGSPHAAQPPSHVPGAPSVGCSAHPEPMVFVARNPVVLSPGSAACAPRPETPPHVLHGDGCGEDLPWEPQLSVLGPPRAGVSAPRPTVSV